MYKKNIQKIKNIKAIDIFFQKMQKLKRFFAMLKKSRDRKVSIMKYKNEFNYFYKIKRKVLLI